MFSVAQVAVRRNPRPFVTSTRVARGGDVSRSVDAPGAAQWAGSTENNQCCDHAARTMSKETELSGNRLPCSTSRLMSIRIEMWLDSGTDNSHRGDRSDTVGCSGANGGQSARLWPFLVFADCGPLGSAGFGQPRCQTHRWRFAAEKKCPIIAINARGDQALPFA